jgi:hypothetical protein
MTTTQNAVREKRGNLPTELTIRRHWCDQLWNEKGFDSRAEFMERGNCFACGMNPGGSLERAHIHARTNGGSDTADNLHMLCRTCHRDSEYLEGDDYWRWFWERTSTDMLMSSSARSGINLWSMFMKPKLVRG